ncbi:MAG: hypothetical protein RL642_1414 [Bacteroidota bacterium]|jgi:hypothetical protein
MKKIISLTYLVLLLFAPVLAWPGGTSGPSGGPGFNDNGQTLDTPVDGGIVTVTALAIGYGVRQARKRKEDKNNDNGAV